MGALFSIILALGDAGGPAPFLVRFGGILLFVEWNILVLTGILVLIRSWLEQQTLGRAFSVVIAIALITITASNVGLFWWSAAVENSSTSGGTDRYEALFRNLALGVVFVFAALQYLTLFQRWKAQLEAEAQARMDSLQARIRPHFLFNTLNTIASLVRTRPDEAEQAVLDLADLLRSGLRTNAEHTLSEELELVRGYLRIESQRLGERLAIDWRVEDSLPLGQTIPALLVQPLVENAVVHGISKLPDGGCLKISARATRGKRWSVRVENPWPGPGASAAGEGNRMALDNIRQRLELAYGERASLKTESTAERFSAEIRVPITAAGE